MNLYSWVSSQENFAVFVFVSSDVNGRAAAVSWSGKQDAWLQHLIAQVNCTRAHVPAEYCFYNSSSDVVQIDISVFLLSVMVQNNLIKHFNDCIVP